MSLAYLQVIHSIMRIAIQYELGGKDAAYIREDADLDYCIDHLLFFALYNSGQNCYKAERFYGI
jgi:acyl-CoA reductase-like NAD-dependent aldehyde dehydrogenase